MEWDRTQAELHLWVQRNFAARRKEAGRTFEEPLLGMTEAIGTLARNLRKGLAKPEHRLALRHAIGDAMIYMLDFCNEREFAASTVVSRGRHFKERRDCGKITEWSAMIHVASAIGGVADCLHDEALPHEHRSLCEQCGDPQGDLAMIVAGLLDLCEVWCWDLDEIVAESWNEAQRRSKVRERSTEQAHV